ncbi:MAG: hypothetical protein ACYS7Y_04025 [Planctomycetota bacterium]|jgi:hypothetical protein
MIGYHYTTMVNWNGIQESGELRLGRCRQHELDRFRESAPRLQEDVIWVWKNPLTDIQAWIVTALLSTMHGDFNLALLELTYPESDSCSLIYLDDPCSTLRFTCEFSAGNLDTGNLPIDLIANNVPMDRIRLLWEGDLLSPFYGRHTEYEKCLSGVDSCS